MDSPSLDKLQSIRAFAKVVQHGSFAAAAREMRLSRSAVSKCVIDLEQDLGTQLLVRTTRSACPTENGQAYYARCIAILADLEEADLSVTRLQAEPRGILRVNRSHLYMMCSDINRTEAAFFLTNKPKKDHTVLAGVGAGLERLEDQGVC